MEQALNVNELYLSELRKALKRFGYSIIENSKVLESSAKVYDLHKDKEGIKVEGHKGTWYVIGTSNIDNKDYFLLEHENFGDEAAHIITDVSGKLILDDVYNGFEDLKDFLEDEPSLSGAKDFLLSQIESDFDNEEIDEKSKNILMSNLDFLSNKMFKFYKDNLSVQLDEELNFVGELFKSILSLNLDGMQSDSLLYKLIWENQNNSVKIYDLHDNQFGLSISYGRTLPLIIKQGIESVFEHLESEFGLTAKERENILESLNFIKDKDVSFLIVDETNSIVGRIERDGNVSAVDYCFEQIKGAASNVREYLKRFNISENIKVEALKNYRLLSEYNNIALGCMITEGMTQFATWQTNDKGDSYDWGHYYVDDYAKAKEDFSERSGLHAKVQFSEIELKLIFSSLQFSGKTGDLNFDDLKAVESLKEKISDLLPELRELKEQEIDLDIEPDYPV